MVFTQDQQQCLQVLRSGANTFLTGAGGTGKSALIYQFVKELRNQGKMVLVTASTGCAAELIGGSTIHSCLGWRLGLPWWKLTEEQWDEKTEALNRASALIVDEISMLHPDFLPFLCECLCRSTPVQLIAVGDFSQLPPVESDRYAFETREWNWLNLTPCGLTTAVRQRDPLYMRLLSDLRIGETGAVYEIFRRCAKERIPNAISLCATRDAAAAENLRRLCELPGNPFPYRASTNGTPNWEDTQLMPVLCLKRNSRVMTLVNSTDYKNGSFGTVVSLPNGKGPIRILLDRSGKEVDIDRIERYVSVYKNPNLACTVCQYPLRPADAITIHKAQGMTFDAVNILDPHYWSPGQCYTALSRAKSLEGMYIESMPNGCLGASEAVKKFYQDNFAPFVPR